MRLGLAERINEEKNDKKEEKQCRWWQRYLRFLHRLISAHINGGGSERQCWRVPIYSVKIENRYTRKRRQLRLAKGLDFFEKFLTLCFMHYLYLDESGDLGHQIGSPGASRHFVITILEVADDAAKKAIEKAVVKTMQNKIRKKRPRGSVKVTELKATNTEFAVKQYFYRQVEAVPFNLYTAVLEKSRFINHLKLNPNRVYGFITHLALKELPLEQATTRVIFTLDKCMGSSEILGFNQALIKQMELRIPPQVPLSINHSFSHENKPLQAVDLFAWGIYRKYEMGDSSWYDVFRKKIAYELVYPKK